MSDSSWLSSMSNLLAPFSRDDASIFAADNDGPSFFGFQIWGVSWWIWLIGSYLIAELVFAFLVYKVWIPELNKPKEHPIIRSFQDLSVRHKLFERMLRRQESLCEALDVNKKVYFAEYIRNWFFHGGDREDWESSDEPLACIKDDGPPCREDIDALISWGFFQTKSSEMNQEQRESLAKMYAMIKDTYDMEPGPKTKQRLIACNMTLEDLDIMYRPLAVYMLVFLWQGIIVSLLLYWLGFSHHVTSTGLPYWYRPANNKQRRSSSADQHQEPEPLPFLFFHGIAPTGACPYLPMILGGLVGAEGLATDENGNMDRPIFLFQNPAVAFNLSSHAPTEQETCDGVWEAVDKHLGPSAEVSLAGHSFGTCLQTYILQSSQGRRVRQMILMDPVSICLSDPDVITNFVYGRSHHRDTKLHDSVDEPGAASWVMNELFIEHFLRRQFAWYNGELFLEDIPDTCRLIVCLADADEISNAQKIKGHLDIYNGNTPSIMPRCMQHLKLEGNQNSNSPTKGNNGATLSSNASTVSSTGSQGESGAGKPKIDVIYWEGEGIGHGSCLANPSAWRQMRRMMRKQELQIAKEERKKDS